jgi:hypothetical protein
MSALSTLFPVFFMIALGFVSKIKNWITPQQKAGANAIVFNILFPIMIFNILLTAKLETSAIFLVGYVFIMFCLMMIIGKLLSKFTGQKYSHVSKYLLTTCEGGNVALPLYISIVGAAYSSNTVIFDIAGTLVAFVIIPILVAKESAGHTNAKDLIKQIFTNSFVLAVILALILNLSGAYHLLETTSFIDIYTNTISQATAPIVGMILFIIGYDLNIDRKTIVPILKLVMTRVILFTIIILGFFILFPHLMADKIYMIAVILYFMCPTGFAMPMLISPLYKNEDDESFVSAFISIYMIITLIVYTCLVLFVA